MIILGIETSCDETSAGILADGEIRSNIVSSQLVHQKYGGVVPELASRAHQRLIVPVVAEALESSGTDKKDLGAVAVTYGPGLAGALMVGISFGKTLAYALKIPVIGVNHLEGHLYSNFISRQSPGFPYICLIVSGGHTQIVLVHEPLSHELLGETLDDAAGEAYDKVAKMLGLGFPGGPVIDTLAQKGNPDFLKLPRSYLSAESFDFSFSGIKTSVLYWLRGRDLVKSGLPVREIDRNLLCDLCASFQAAVADVLVKKTLRAAEKYNIKNIALAGGVSANSELRKRFRKFSLERGFGLYIPDTQFCTDNGAMTAVVGRLKLEKGEKSDFSLTAVPDLSM